VFIIQDGDIKVLLGKPYDDQCHFGATMHKEDMTMKEVYKMFENMDDALWLLKFSKDLSKNDLCVLLKNNNNVDGDELIEDSLSCSSDNEKHEPILLINEKNETKTLDEGPKDDGPKYQNTGCQIDMPECMCKKTCRVLKSKNAVRCYIGTGVIIGSMILYYYLPMIASGINRVAHGATSMVKSGMSSVCSGVSAIYGTVKSCFTCDVPDMVCPTDQIDMPTAGLNLTDVPDVGDQINLT
jgi:hypothetical protein